MCDYELDGNFILLFFFFLFSETVFWSFILHSLSELTASLLTGSDEKLFKVTVGDDRTAAFTRFKLPITYNVCWSIYKSSSSF